MIINYACHSRSVVTNFEKKLREGIKAEMRPQKIEILTFFEKISVIKFFLLNKFFDKNVQHLILSRNVQRSLKISAKGATQ